MTTTLFKLSEPNAASAKKEKNLFKNFNYFTTIKLEIKNLKQQKILLNNNTIQYFSIAKRNGEIKKKNSMISRIA